MIQVSSYINNDPAYLAARNDFVNDTKNTTRYPTLCNLELVHRDIFPMMMNETFMYTDEYNHLAYYTVDTRKSYWSQVRPWTSVAYESDEYGVPENVDIFNWNIVANNGINMIDAHYATVFDCMHESRNRQLDCDEEEEVREEDFHAFVVETICNHLTMVFDTDCVCSICLDNKHEEQIATKCNHVFHRNCIMQWVQASIENVKCPYCRTSLL